MREILWCCASLFLWSCAITPTLGSMPKAPVEQDSEVDQEPLELGSTWVQATTPLVAHDGRSVAIESVRKERGTLVIFTCNHCPWAQRWEERIVTLGNEYFEKGVGVIAINPNDPAVYQDDSLAAMKARSEAAGMKFPYVADPRSQVARAFGASKTPEIFLFDQENKLVYYGAVDDNAESPAQVKAHYLKDALVALTEGRPVPLARTKAFGCSIKFKPNS